MNLRYWLRHPDRIFARVGYWAWGRMNSEAIRECFPLFSGT